MRLKENMLNNIVLQINSIQNNRVNKESHPRQLASTSINQAAGPLPLFPATDTEVGVSGEAHQGSTKALCRI